MSKTEQEATALNLHQKIVELRKCVPYIQKERYSDKVDYKFAKIDSVWKAITPKMNELNVVFDVTKETDPTVEAMTVKTKFGERLMWVYRANLTIQWTDADNPDDVLTAEIHAIGWNDDPAKAKGAAWTYALKYYLFEKFSIDMGDDDPDNQNLAPEGQEQSQKEQKPQEQHKTPPATPQEGNKQPAGTTGKLTDKQISRLNAKAIAAGVSKEQLSEYIAKKYKKAAAKDLTREEYDELCKQLDAAVAKGGHA